MKVENTKKKNKKECKLIENKKNKILLIIIICATLLIVIFIISFCISKSDLSLTAKEAELLLKEKDEFYKEIISPQPYCGKSAKIIYSDDNEWPVSDEEYNDILYWAISSEFYTYSDLKNYVMKNISNDLIEKIQSNTLNQNLYLEKNNKLYCGRLGAGHISPKTTYDLIKYDKTSISGTITNTYDKEAIDMGLAVNNKINIVLVKENDFWKIDTYEFINNNVTSNDA